MNDFLSAGRDAAANLQDHEAARAALRLMSELAEGKRSGEQEGWLSAAEVRAHLRARVENES